MNNDVRNIVEDKDFTNKWLVNTLFNIPKSEYDNIAATLRYCLNQIYICLTILACVLENCNDEIFKEIWNYNA
jgi:hypothetical protein